MGIENRDWFWEDRKKREEEYGGDFNLHSKKVKKYSEPLSNKSVSQTDKIKGYIIPDIVTIAIGFLLCWGFKAGFFIPNPMSDDGHNEFFKLLMCSVCFALGLFLFVRAARSRKRADKGLLNVIALIVSMLIFTFMAVLLFSLIPILM